MARPQKNRKIQEPPVFSRFKPAGTPGRMLGKIVLKIDEYEALRLADHQGLSHEEASDQMEISRPTFTRLLETARQKLTGMLVEGKMLIVEGGSIHFRKNIIKCRSCGNFHNTDISRSVKKCPSCGSEDIINLAGDLGHGKCCFDDE